MKKIFIFFICIFAYTAVFADAKKISIASSMTDFASIAKYIGKDKVDVFSVTNGTYDPHSVEILPSYMIKIAKADIYLKAGLALDRWADDLISGSGSNKIKIVSCDKDINVLDKDPHATVAKGDVHPFGNPHYWLNPANGIAIASSIKNALSEIDARNKIFYQENYENFIKEINENVSVWSEKMAPFKDANFISYHSSWVYFADFFKINIIANVEPFPGIPPTAKHLNNLIKTIKENNVKVLFQEIYFSKNAGKFLRNKTDITVVTESPSCKGVGEDAYFKHFDAIINMITADK